MPVGHVVTGILGVTKVWENELVNGLGYIYSQIYKIESNQVCGVWVQATSVAGVPSLDCRIQQSFDTTEANFVTPEAAPDVFTTLADELPHIYTVIPYPMSYLRFEVAGDGANPIDTLFTMYLFLQ